MKTKAEEYNATSCLRVEIETVDKGFVVLVEDQYETSKRFACASYREALVEVSNALACAFDKRDPTSIHNKLCTAIDENRREQVKALMSSLKPPLEGSTDG